MAALALLYVCTLWSSDVAERSLAAPLPQVNFVPSQPFVCDDAKHRHAQIGLMNAQVVSAVYVATNVARMRVSPTSSCDTVQLHTYAALRPTLLASPWLTSVSSAHSLLTAWRKE